MVYSLRLTQQYLSIASSLVQLQGGSITVSSPGPGKGAAFTLNFPTTTTTTTATTTATSLPQSSSSSPALQLTTCQDPLRILLVEDNACTSLLLQRMLRTRLGHQLTSVSSVKEAIHAARKIRQFDLLISDIGLPDGDGRRLMRDLMQGGHIVLGGIAISGYGSDEDRRASLACGFTEHLVKPFLFESLRRAIANVVGSRGSNISGRT